MIPFNYHHLYYFYAIARAGSVTKAAAELRLGQPTLSSQLKHFEQYLGTKLFIRDGKKLMLTEEGRYVLAYASDIFDTGRELLEGFKDLSRRKGRDHMRIGVSNSVPKAFIDALLKFLLKKDPEVYLSVKKDHFEALLEDLKTHLLDLVLSDAPHQSIADEEIENHLAGRVPIVFCAIPTLARKYKRFPKDSDGAPLILPTSHSQIYHAVQEYLVANRVKARIVGEIQDIEVVRRLALSGFGIAPLNQFTIQNAPSRETLIILDKDPAHKIFDDIYVLAKKRKKPRALVTHVLGHFRLKV